MASWLPLVSSSGVTVYCKFSCDELLVQYCFKRQSCALGNASIFKCWKTFVKKNILTAFEMSCNLWKLKYWLNLFWAELFIRIVNKPSERDNFNCNTIWQNDYSFKSMGRIVVVDTSIYMSWIKWMPFICLHVSEASDSSQINLNCLLLSTKFGQYRPIILKILLLLFKLAQLNITSFFELIDYSTEFSLSKEPSWANLNAYKRILNSQPSVWIGS